MRITNRTQRVILGEEQWQALEAWLLAVKDDYPVKFLVSSGALLFQMWVDFARDRWAGFPSERRRLLHFIAANGIEGVHVLCGDLHSAHAIRADLYGPQGQALPLWEFCSSPFEQKTNWLARHTYHPVRGAPIRGQKNYFTIAENNFGIVRIDFDENEKPLVTFELYGEGGDRLAQLSCQAESQPIL